MSTESDAAETLAWNEWFDRQRDLCHQVDKAVAGLSEGKSDMFRAALWSGVLEHGAETIRRYIPLVPPETEPTS